MQDTLYRQALLVSTLLAAVLPASARLKQRTAIGPETIFDRGSISNQLAAAAVVMPEVVGPLDLDLGAIPPEMPDFGTPITVRHPAHDTSGFREIRDAPGRAVRRRDPERGRAPVGLRRPVQEREPS